MRGRRSHTGLLVSLVVLVGLSVLAAGGVLAFPDRTAALLGSPVVHWRTGTPASTPAARELATWRARPGVIASRPSSTEASVNHQLRALALLVA